MKPNLASASAILISSRGVGEVQRPVCELAPDRITGWLDSGVSFRYGEANCV